VLIVLKSRSLNLLEPSGPVKVCNGIVLPLPLPLQHADRGVTAPCTLKLGINKDACSVRPLLWLFHTLAEKSPRHALHMILGGPQKDGRDRAAYITDCRQALAAAQTWLAL
jgi:hypothetical protein